MHKQIANLVDLKNEYVKEVLDNIALQTNNLIDNSKIKFNNENFLTATSEQTCDDIISLGINHSGYPDDGNMLELLSSDAVTDDKIKKNTYYMNEVRPKILQYNIDIQYFLGSRNAGIFTYYPPNGYISWHNNANAPGYNVLFTWSETGDGYFAYRDENNQTVKVHDKKGWSAKMCYFPSYSEEIGTFYHSASTNCRRITCAYRFEDGEAIWKDLKEDLENE